MHSRLIVDLVVHIVIPFTKSYFAGQGWSSASGSGSGSGSGASLSQPMFVGCPVTTLNETLNATVGTSQLSISMGWPTTTGASVSASATSIVLPLSFAGSVIIRTALSPSGNSLSVTVEDQYGELSSSNTIQLTVSLIATSVQMIQSQPCNFTVEIAVQDPAVCTSIQSGQQLTNPPSAIQQLYSITLTVGIPISNVSYSSCNLVTSYTCIKTS